MVVPLLRRSHRVLIDIAGMHVSGCCRAHVLDVIAIGQLGDPCAQLIRVQFERRALARPRPALLPLGLLVAVTPPRLRETRRGRTANTIRAYHDRKRRACVSLRRHGPCAMRPMRLTRSYAILSKSFPPAAQMSFQKDSLRLTATGYSYQNLQGCLRRLIATERKKVRV